MESNIEKAPVKNVCAVFCGVEGKSEPSKSAYKRGEVVSERAEDYCDEEEDRKTVRHCVEPPESQVAVLVEYRDDRARGKVLEYSLPKQRRMERYASCFFTDVAVNIQGHVGVLFPIAVGVRTENRRTNKLYVKKVVGRVVLGHTDEKVAQEQEMYAWLVLDKRTDGTLPAYADLFEGSLPCMARLRPHSDERYCILATGSDRMRYDLRVGAPSKEFGSVNLDYGSNYDEKIISYSGESNRYEDMTSALYVVTAVQSWTVQENHPESTGNETSCFFDMYYEEDM